MGLSGKERLSGKETEVKLRVSDRRALLRRLSQLRAIYQGRVHEMNTLYDTPAGALVRAGKLLRIRVERPADRPAYRTPNSPKPSRAPGGSLPALLTYKGPSQPEHSSKARRGPRYKIREEREVHVADESVLPIIFDAIGFRPSFRYEKYRSTYRLPHLPGVVIELDETPIGDFLELEGHRSAIDRAAALLGYRPSDYVTKSYGQLFVEGSRGTGQTKRSKREWIPGANSRDMLFRTKK
jgi:adenylate cyclase, class 2